MKNDSIQGIVQPQQIHRQYFSDCFQTDRLQSPTEFLPPSPLQKSGTRSSGEEAARFLQKIKNWSTGVPTFCILSHH